MSFGGQSNAWQHSVMQGHLQSNSFHQGPQEMFIQTPRQNNMVAFGHGGCAGGGIYPNSGAGGSVSYPQPRTGLNPVAFQGSGGGGVGGIAQTHYNSIGSVTKMSNDCGLVNNEVFFYRNVCKGPEPKLGDRVIFEATYSTAGHFKWNATRIQLMQPNPLPIINSTKSNYASVSPLNEYQLAAQMQRHPSPKRVLSPLRGAVSGIRHERERERQIDRSRDRDDDEHDRKRRREDYERSRDRNNTNIRASGGSNAVVSSGNYREWEREREPRRERDREREQEREQREKGEENDKEGDRENAGEVECSAVRKGRRSRRIRGLRRYMVQIPKHLLSHKNADFQELRNRYTTLYIPPDFFRANMKWTETFTPDNSFSLRRPCEFHIMHKLVEPPYEQKMDDLEPVDADYVYSAKVMLMELPPIAEIYNKCFVALDHHPTHPSRLINFLVEVGGNNEPQAIGGPWSPSLDGENPDTDPSVLIRTAIRTCKALTGIDLSNCTQWYRFVELYYHRTEYKNMEKDAPPRVETVVIYLPDVHSCMPTVKEYETLCELYKTSADNVIARRAAAFNKVVAAASTNEDNNESTNVEGANDTAAGETEPNEDGGANVDAEGDGGGDGANVDIAEEEGDGNNAAEAGGNNENGDQDEQMENSGISSEANDVMGQNVDNTHEAADENEEPSLEPKHYTLLYLKNMKVQEIRNELLARDLPDTGVRNVVMARLTKALNTEKAEEMKAKNRERLQKLQQQKKSCPRAKKKADKYAIDFELSELRASVNPGDKAMTEKEKKQLMYHYTLPPNPQIVVHPNKLAQGGNFKCAVMSLSALLYSKERFFEEEPSLEPTHYTLLYLKNMKAQEIRNELLARDLPDTGVRNVVMARLTKALNTEKAEEMKAKNRERLQKKSCPRTKKKADKDAIDFELSELRASVNPGDKAMTEKEKKQLMFRYTSPPNPQIVMHPNKLAQGGNFKCTGMSLSALLYAKERFFEVSLFFELFNEMLKRDFAFTIYKEIYVHNEKESPAEGSGEGEDAKLETSQTEEANSDEKAAKELESEVPPLKIRKRRRSTVHEREQSDDNGGEKQAPPKRRMSTFNCQERDQLSSDDKKVVPAKPQGRMSTVDGREPDTTYNELSKKMVVVKPQLLLSFLFFDTTRCGYIFVRDLEDLFTVLGLNLSRTQIKKVLGKLATRESIYYRQLTDKEESAECTPCIEDIDKLPVEELRDIASGNNKYEFVFGETHAHGVVPIDGDGNNDGDLINYNGAVIHVGKLMHQIKRTEKNYSDLEKLYNDLLKQHDSLKSKDNVSRSKIKDLQSDTESLSRKLTDTNQDLYSLNRKYRDQNSTLSCIYTRVSPYFSREKNKEKNSKTESSHKAKDEKKKEDGKSKDKESASEKDNKKENNSEKYKEKDKGKDKERDKEKAKEGEKDKLKDKDNRAQNKGKEVEKEKSTETDKKEKPKENDKPKETEKEIVTSKDAEKERNTSKEQEMDTPEEKETCEEKETSVSNTQTGKGGNNKEEEKVPVKVKEKEKPKCGQADTPKEATKPAQATVAKATPAKATPAKVVSAKATPAKAVPAKTISGKGTPAKAVTTKATLANATTSAKTTAAPVKATASTAKATPAKVNPAAKKPVATVVKKVVATTENSQK